MADLLSASDWTTIRAALQDVMDTFFKKSVTLVHRRTRNLSKFHEDREADLQTNNYALLALYVPEHKDDENSQSEEVNKGYSDFSEGVFYFNYQALLTHNPPLIVNGEPDIISNKDSIIVDGKEVTIIGVNLVGPTESNFQLVKISYKKELQA